MLCDNVLTYFNKPEDQQEHPGLLLPLEGVNVEPDGKLRLVLQSSLPNQPLKCMRRLPGAAQLVRETSDSIQPQRVAWPAIYPHTTAPRSVQHTPTNAARRSTIPHHNTASHPIATHRLASWQELGGPDYHRLVLQCSSERVRDGWLDALKGQIVNDLFHQVGTRAIDCLPACPSVWLSSCPPVCLPVCRAPGRA